MKKEELIRILTTLSILAFVWVIDYASHGGINKWLDTPMSKTTTGDVVGLIMIFSFFTRKTEK